MTAELVQLALRYSGRDGGQAPAWHVATGILVFGLSVGVDTLLHSAVGTNEWRIQ